MRRTCVPSRSRESSERCIARPIGSCCTTSPRTAGCCCLETRIRINMACRQPGDTRERDLTWLRGFFRHGHSRQTARPLIFAGSVGVAAPSGNPTLFRRQHGWFSGGPDWRGGRRGLVSRREVGARVVRRESGPPADRGWCDGHAPEGKRDARSETEHGSATRSALSSRATPETASPEATFRRSRPAFLGRLRRMAWFSPAKRRCATTTPSSVASAPRGCSFRFKAEMVSLFRRSRLETSRFNGATTADTCIRSTTSRAPGRRPLTSFAWSWRPAAGFSGKRSRRPTPWESKT